MNPPAESPSYVSDFHESDPEDIVLLVVFEMFCCFKMSVLCSVPCSAAGVGDTEDPKVWVVPSRSLQVGDWREPEESARLCKPRAHCRYYFSK